MNVLMLYPKFPEQTFWNTAGSIKLLWGRKAIIPPLGLLTIASYLPEDFSIRLVDRNVCEEFENDLQWADVVFLSVMMAQRQDYRACLEVVKRYGKPVAVGGPLTHAMPEVACADGDWVCFGEAETIMEEFVRDLRADRRDKQYQGGSQTNMELVKTPRFDLLSKINDYATMALQFSRGCPFKCEFCDIIEIYGRVPRTKSPAQICTELATLERLGFEGYIFLVDDNFIGNKRKAKGMLSELALWNREHSYRFRYYTEASINLADDHDMLQRMAEAGFFQVFVGIETPDPKLLKTTQKMQNIPGGLLHKLGLIRAQGIHITAGFIVGFDGEERGVFDGQRECIQASGIGVAMVGMLQAIPHTQLSRRLKAEGRLLETLSSTGNHTIEGINFIPMAEMSKRQYLENYRALVRWIYQPKAYFARVLSGLLELRAHAPLPALWRYGAKLVAVLLKEAYHLGFKDKSIMRYFWKALLKLLFKNPRALECFAFDSAVFYHLYRHAVYIDDEIRRYLTAPEPNDVLDSVVVDSSRMLDNRGERSLAARIPM